MPRKKLSSHNLFIHDVFIHRELYKHHDNWGKLMSLKSTTDKGCSHHPPTGSVTLTHTFLHRQLFMPCENYTQPSWPWASSLLLCVLVKHLRAPVDACFHVWHQSTLWCFVFYQGPYVWLFAGKVCHSLRCISRPSQVCEKWQGSQLMLKK